jgi:hypothetical protein
MRYRTEQEFGDEVRRRMIEGLPVDQRPIITNEEDFTLAGE